MIAERERETRCLRASEIRVEGDGASPRLRGYASVFGTWASINGVFKEMVKAGAFRKTLAEHNVVALYNHNTDHVLGSTRAKTLTLEEDGRGLRVEILPPKTAMAADVIEMVRRGDVAGMSIGFDVIKADEDYVQRTRVLEEIRLYEVSLTAMPAFSETSVAVRSAFEAKAQPTPQRDELDALVEKIRSKSTLTADELRTVTRYIPGLTIAPEPPKGWRALLDEGGNAAPKWRALLNQ